MTLLAQVEAVAPSVVRPSWCARGYGSDVIGVVYTGDLGLRAAVARLQQHLDLTGVVAVEVARVLPSAGSPDVAIYLRTAAPPPAPAPENGA